jgi:hypothetical protein
MLLRELWMAMWGVNIRYCFHSIEAHGQLPVYLEINALGSINKSINRQISLSLILVPTFSTPYCEA